MKNVQHRNVGIDILKFFAVILITNSHMDLLYGRWSILATGGAIGDALFFFCSGFTLFLGQKRRFDNYYKRRIQRIYPTVFMNALLACLFFHRQHDIVFVLLHGGGWFVSCIMIYYVVLYFIHKYAFHRLKTVFIAYVLFIVAWYFMQNRSMDFNMYGETYFKWGHYFLFMLFGAIVGTNNLNNTHSSFIKRNTFMTILSIVLFYFIIIIGRKFSIMCDIQIISLAPLLFVIYYLYRLCSSQQITSFFLTSRFSSIMKIISGLCLEIYLVQGFLLTDKYNNIFPFNIPAIFFCIILLAYVLRCMARWFSQTFRTGDYNWAEIVKLY